jgi:hypothetical protein
MTTQQTQSAELGALAAALVKAQTVMEGAKETETNPYFKSSYADLKSVWAACKVPLTSNGLSIVQTVENGGEKAYLVTTLLHTSGQWIRSYMPILMTKQDAQSLGSAITYCRRYALAAIVGVCPVDDDGEAAIGRDSKKEVEPPISKMQADELEFLLQYRGDVRDRMLDWVGVDYIKEIPASLYTKVVGHVKTELKKEPKQ